MQCVNVDNVNFTSRIMFVDGKTFGKVRRGNFIPWQTFSAFIQNADEFYTESVRTCTAGALINTKKRKVVGFHIFDCFQNFKTLPNLVNKMLNLADTPDKCILLGGKYLGDSPYSMGIYCKFQELLKGKIDKITLFKEHSYPWSETDISYSLKDDVLYVSSMFRDNKDFKEQFISSPNQLEKCFKTIKLSPDDKLIFS